MLFMTSEEVKWLGDRVMLVTKNLVKREFFTTKTQRSHHNVTIPVAFEEVEPPIKLNESFHKHFL